MKPTLLYKLLALLLCGALSACTGTITSPNTGITYDFSLKPRPAVVVEVAK